MLNGQQLRRVMHRAIAIVVVANRAVEHVVAENPIECLHLRGRCLRGLGGDPHSLCDSSRAGPHQAAVRFNHARVTRLNRTELRVVADVGDRPASTVDQIDEKLVGLGFLNDTVNRNVNHRVSSSQLVASPVPVALESEVTPSKCVTRSLAANGGRVGGCSAATRRVVTARGHRPSRYGQYRSALVHGDAIKNEAYPAAPVSSRPGVLRDTRARCSRTK